MEKEKGNGRKLARIFCFFILLFPFQNWRGKEKADTERRREKREILVCSNNRAMS